jgi:SAM-dependent methyltransferase
MFENYKDIFNQRGFAYHEGMLKYPLARVEEFKQVIQLAEMEDGNIILDVPSGGCYLSNFMNKKVKIISVETSSQFVQDTQSSDSNTVLVCEDITDIPLTTEIADRILSVAGLHHVSDKFAFYQESFRLLKTNGLFLIADAFHDSKVANFLNIFVHQNNSMGHNGEFLDRQAAKELEAVGFQVLYNSSISYFWQFDSPQDMAKYCRLLFGIDRADESTIVEGIDTYLGYQIKQGKCYMNWELHFLKCIK